MINRGDMRGYNKYCSYYYVVVVVVVVVVIDMKTLVMMISY